MALLLEKTYNDNTFRQLVSYFLSLQLDLFLVLSHFLLGTWPHFEIL